MYLALALLGSCLGILPYNFRPRGPARIFLGDAGGTFLGFSLAAMAVMGGWGVQYPMERYEHRRVARSRRGDHDLSGHIDPDDGGCGGLPL